MEEENEDSHHKKNDREKHSNQTQNQTQIQNDSNNDEIPTLPKVVSGGAAAVGITAGVTDALIAGNTNNNNSNVTNVAKLGNMAAAGATGTAGMSKKEGTPASQRGSVRRKKSTSGSPGFVPRLGNCLCIQCVFFEFFVFVFLFFFWFFFVF